MAKNITLKDNDTGRSYTLEYTRRTAQMLESAGFIAEEIDSKPNTMIPLLVQGAFLKHHRGLPQKEIDKIYDRLANKEGLLAALVDMYGETFTSLTADPVGDDEKNCEWTQNW